MRDDSRALTGQQEDRRRALREAMLREAGVVAPTVVRIPTHRAEGPSPLSFAQERIWFLYQLDPGKAHYNVSRTMRLEGPLNVAALEQSINEIVRRHETLRTVFFTEGSLPVQTVLPVLPLPLTHIDLMHNHKSSCGMIAPSPLQGEGRGEAPSPPSPLQGEGWGEGRNRRLHKDSCGIALSGQRQEFLCIGRSLSSLSLQGRGGG